MPRILLVNMPWSDVDRPSLGLSLLQAAVRREGMHCDIAYLNLRFAELIGLEQYANIDAFEGGPQIGEWIFSHALFAGEASSPSRYFHAILKPAMARPFDQGAAALESLFADADVVAGLEQLQATAASFLASCLQGYDWAAYDVVGFTSTFQQNTPSLGLARRIKQAHPQLRIVFGGANCEGEMGVAMHRHFPFIDAVCSGEGDHSFTSYLKALARGGTTQLIDGIIARDDRGSTVVPLHLTHPVRDMDALPIPDYTDFFAQREHLAGSRPGVTLPIESSRGCWWGEKSHCTFCGLNGGTMKFRAKSPARFLGELEALSRKHAIRDFSAADNIIDMKYFGSVLPALARRSDRLRLFYEVKANLQREQVRLLRAAGVTHIQPGIESLSTAVLRVMRKGVHAYQNVRLLRWCGEYLVHPSWNLLGGFPGEDPAEYEKQAQLLPLLHHLTPPTGVTAVRLDRFSPLFEEATQLGVSSVRPCPVYGHIYPFSAGELGKLVYFFEFEHADGRDPQGYLAAIRRAAQAWKEAEAFDSLVYLDDGERLTIADRRPSAAANFHELEGIQRLVYLQCEDGRGLAGVKLGLATNGQAAVSDAQVSRILERLLDARLIAPIDDRFVALAVGGNYRLEELARCLLNNQEVPADLRQAVQRLFDLHREGFGRHLAECLHHGEAQMDMGVGGS